MLNDPYNLIENAWIPVRWKSGSDPALPSRVSLTDAFAKGRDIADLDCAPHERIALTRLLVCITHAALGAPEDAVDWEGFGEDLEARVPAYLSRPEIHPHFNLLGDGPRFLQESLPEKGDPVPSSKLFPELATGNNPTLLDHAGMLPERSYDAAVVAVALLAFQNFYPLYGAGYKGRGPCSDSNALHALLCGNDLRETILLNLMDRKTIEGLAPVGFGKSSWECATQNELEESTLSYLGRLVPRHRSLRLTRDLSGFYHRKTSLQYPGWEPCREPSVTTVLNKKEERRLLPARIDRSIWRDLHSITALNADQANGSAQAPAVFASHADALDEGTVRVWTGALITDLKAKILDTVESTFTLPHEMFSEAGRLTYMSGVEHAETISQKLYGAVKAYWGALKHENAPTPEAQRHFWHALDQNHRQLIVLAGDPDSLRGRPGFGQPGADDDWTNLVRKAALRAFESTCPRTTPRQIQAYAAGMKPLLKFLYPRKPAEKTKTGKKQPA